MSAADDIRRELLHPAKLDLIEMTEQHIRENVDELDELNHCELASLAYVCAQISRVYGELALTCRRRIEGDG